MSDIEINKVIAKMRVMTGQMGTRAGIAADNENTSSDFGVMMKKMVDQVNQNQQHAGQLKEAFELGDQNIDVSRVMIEMQRARISFETLVQVRNKIVSAYQEIMNMQV